MTPEKFVLHLTKRHPTKLPNKGYGKLLNKIAANKKLKKDLLHAIDPLLVNLTTVKPEIIKQLLSGA